MSKLTMDEIRVKNLLAYEYIRGSHLYNLNVEGSDLDTGGVYIAPLEQVIGLGDDYQPEVSKDPKHHDDVWYEINKFVGLLLKSNPTVLEALYVPQDKIISDVHPFVKEILDNKEMFLTKEVFKPMMGYAYNQIAKAQGLNKKIMKPMIERKDVIDFVYTFHGQGSMNFKSWMEARGLKQRYCGLVNINNMHDMYGLYYDWGNHILNENYKKDDLYDLINFNVYKNELKDKINRADSLYKLYRTYIEHKGFEISHDSINHFFNTVPIGYRGIVKEDGETESNEVRLSSVSKNEKPLVHISYNKHGYISHCKDYKEYKEWERNRNELRFQTNIEVAKSYDCYFENETEFLTNNGWKKYDEVNQNDLIACFDKNRNLIFSDIKSKTDKLYNGKKYKFENSYSCFSITENHNLFLSPCRRNPKNLFSTKYDKNNCDWNLISVKDYWNKKRSHYHQISNLNNNNSDNTKYSDDFIKVLGLFLSEGCYVWNKLKDGSEVKSGIRISQNKNRCGYSYLKDIKDFKFNYYEYQRENKNEIETTWECNDNFLLNELEHCNGRYCNEKDIPYFVNTFSKRQFDLLIDTMICGDGTIYKKGHKIYYTTSYKLAKSLHTLLILNGYNSQFYGNNEGYKYSDENLGMYQIFISNDKKSHTIINKKIKNKNYGWEITDVKNERVVCFETETGTIITRNNNKMSFHGNCKNMMHTMRLMHMAYEIATNQGFILERTWDRDELLGIRFGKREYQDLIDEANELKDRVEKAIPSCDLPDTPDRKQIDEMLINLRKEQFKHG